MRLVAVKDKEKLEANGIYFSPKTLRRWHSQGINSEIFLKISNRLFVNLDAWQALIAQKAEESAKRARKVRELRG